LLSLSLVAGCGSTVSSAQRRAAQRAGASDIGVEAGGAQPGTDVATDAGDSAGAGGSDTATARRSTSGTSRTGASSTALGPGVSAKEINVGLAYAVNSGVANAALGATGITQGDAKREYEIVIDDINAHGGVAGRKLVPVFHEVDGATTATLATVAQQTCDDWTLDHKVFVAMTAGDDTTRECLHKRGVLQIAGDFSTYESGVFSQYPYYVELSSMSLDRIAMAEVAALDAQKYFTGWNHATGTSGVGKAKVGIVTFDDPHFGHAVDKTLVPALAKLGLAPAAADIIRVQTVQRTSDTGPIAAAVSGAVLKLRSDNVSHVIIFDERGVLTLLFLENAQSQHYLPRYGFNSQNGPQALADGSGLPKQQLVGSLGIGWLPGLDLPPAQNTPTGPYSNEARRKCNALYQSKGITFSDANAEAIGLGICNGFWFFRDTVKLSGDILNKVGFMAGVAKVGTSFQSNSVFATRFTATQHDGVSAVRYYAYDPGCTCMKYTSGNVNVP